MSVDRPRILFVTDLGYDAGGRRYCDEDIWLSAQLRDEFVVALCHPADAWRLMEGYDLVVVRNTGPVLYYESDYAAFRARAEATGVPVYNPLSGRGDMAGKGYLPELSAAGFPVIPTVLGTAQLGLLPEVEQYVVKPVRGADSIGLAYVQRSELSQLEGAGLLVQPRIDFAYEVSFYFVDDQFQYALYAPDPGRRWELEPYSPSDADLEFARRFIAWNAITHGVQRVDACRAPDGELLLVELEDLNPFLSLDRVPPATQAGFVRALKSSLRELLGLAAGEDPVAEAGAS